MKDFLRSQAVTYTVWKTVQDRDDVMRKTIIRKCYYGQANIDFSITLSDFQSYAPTESLFKCDVLYTCTAIDKISTVPRSLARSFCHSGASCLLSE